METRDEGRDICPREKKTEEPLNQKKQKEVSGRQASDSKPVHGRIRPLVLMLSLLLLSGAALGTVFYVQRHRGKKTAPDYVFNYAENQTGDYPTTQGAKRFAELVAERTEGRIEIRVHPNAELGSELSSIEQLRFGGIDFVRVSLSSLNDLSEKSMVLQMPYLYNDSDHMWRVLDGEIGQEIMDSFQGSGVVPLSWYDAGVRNFYTAAAPIERLEDMQGLRIRVQESSLMEDMVRALGAVPVPMIYEKVYSALQTGEVDGAENNWSSYKTMQHHEVAKYYTLDEHMRVPELQIVSQVTWDKLSPEDQAILTECAVESAQYERALWKSWSEDAEARVRRDGTIVIELSPEEKQRFREAMAPLYEKYCGEFLELIEEITRF